MFDVEIDEFWHLVKLVDRALSHTYVTAKRTLYSTAFVRIPVIGSDSRVIKLERKLFIDDVRAIHTEEEAAAKCLTKELKYLLDCASTFSEPVYAMDEDGELRAVGANEILLDRKRLTAPKLKGEPGGVVIECCNEGKK